MLPLGYQGGLLGFGSQGVRRFYAFSSSMTSAFTISNMYFYLHAFVSHLDFNSFGSKKI